MRPVALHLSGFTTFRGPTDIDFTGADLFALTGPTGSGKSSIIDAICFALYGSIPRLTGVAPIVSLGKPEARIRLTFEVEGRAYTVSRLVVRTGEGASQRDVRLEGPDLLVEGVRDVDARIAALLGLGFEHFTRTVVLPQGRFAAFLEDGPAARERLLKQLLDLGVYEEMRRLAASHGSRLDGEIAGVDAQLFDLVVDVETVDSERARRGRLHALAEQVAEWSRSESDLVASLDDLRRRRDARAADLLRLDKLEPPRGLDAIGSELADARSSAEEAARVAAELDSSVAALTAARGEAGEVAAWDRVVEAHARSAELRARIERGDGLLAAARITHEEARARLTTAEEGLSKALADLAALERDHAAHVLRDTIAEGDTCPVCGHEIRSLPVTEGPADLIAGRRRVDDARETREAAAKAAVAAETEAGKLADLLADRRAELETAAAALADAPTAEQAAANRERARRLEEELTVARESAAAAHQIRQAASERLTAAEHAGERASEILDRARDGLAGLDPPVPGRRDPASDWAVLMAWRDDVRAAVAREVDDLDGRIAELQRRRQEVRDMVQKAAQEAGVSDPGDDVNVAVGAVLAACEERLTRMESDLEKKAGLTQRRQTLETDRRRYADMARLLRSDRFQQWLLEEAMVGLVSFANSELATLAGGAYSLVVDGGEFEVIDHRNAEARRSVKTLSGGETFLVSLALALALAERVVATSAIGTARIESMFLDEGFGTLDAETLEVVAAVVQELGSGERMVGIVTHVVELAEQIPIRYVVRKLPEGSTVTRVET